MEAVAAGNVPARHLALLAAVAKGNPRRVAVQAAEGHAVHFEEDRASGGQARLHQVFDHFALPVNRNRAPGQFPHRDAMAAPAEAQFHPFMNQALAPQAFARACLLEHLHGALLQHAGAQPMLDVSAALRLDDHACDALAEEELREQQSRRAGADDPYLRADDACGRHGVLL